MAMSGKGVVRAPQVWYHQFNISMPGDELIMKCPNCGANIYDDVNRCQYCGTYQSTAKTPSVPVQAPAQPVVVNVYGQMPPPAETVEHVYHQVISAKKRPVALLLCLLLGWMGAHKFYVGRNFMGVVYLLTFGLFGIGWALDFLVLLFGGGTDKWGRKLSW